MAALAEGARVRLGVVGAGLIGRRHAQLIAADPSLEIAGVADPSDAGRAVARQQGADHHQALIELVNGREGLATLSATLEIEESARLCRPVRPRMLD